jgi:hypothetical protein
MRQKKECGEKKHQIASNKFRPSFGSVLAEDSNQRCVRGESAGRHKRNTEIADAVFPKLNRRNQRGVKTQRIEFFSVEREPDQAAVDKAK